MKYVAFDQPGPPRVLRLVQGPQAEAGAGEILIHVEAAGVSRADVLQRQGAYPPPRGASPILGLEVAGTVVAIGAGAGGFAIGDSVCALCNGGGYAEYAAVPAGQVLPIPEGWSFVEAATLPENAFTVFDNMIVRAQLRAGETVLVHGGASGIGTTAIMFARALGARPIATAGNDVKALACVKIGADAAINYRSHDFVQETMRLTGDAGADVILDIVGGEYLNRDLQCLALDGRIACIATTGGRMATLDVGTLLQRRGSIYGSSLRPRNAAQKAAIAAGLRARIWPLLRDRSTIVPVVDSLYTFSRAAQAHERLETSAHVGKIVLVPDA